MADEPKTIHIDLDLDSSSFHFSRSDEGWFLLAIPHPVLDEAVYEARHADELLLSIPDDIIRQMAALLPDGSRQS